MALRSTALTFSPGKIRADDYWFSVGTAKRYAGSSHRRASDRFRCYSLACWLQRVVHGREDQHARADQHHVHSGVFVGAVYDSPGGPLHESQRRELGVPISFPRTPLDSRAGAAGHREPGRLGVLLSPGAGCRKPRLRGSAHNEVATAGRCFVEPE